jgi:hypothetical protein
MAPTAWFFGGGAVFTLEPLWGVCWRGRIGHVRRETLFPGRNHQGGHSESPLIKTLKTLGRAEQPQSVSWIHVVGLNHAC